MDLILSYGISITDVEVVDSVISDHFPILFKMSLHMLSITPASDTTQARAYLPHFCEYFVKQALKRSLSVIGSADTAYCDQQS